MSNSSTPSRIDRYVPVDHSQVDFNDGFWKSWTEIVRGITVPSQHRRLDEEGFLEVLNFRDPPAPLVRPIQPSGLSMQHFFDSDFGKWIEAASYTLKTHPNPDLELKIDDIVDKLAEGQMEDGYLNSYFIRREPDKRWSNLRDLHEMYSMGHLLEGAIAYFEATGKRRFLDVMLRLVDHIIDTFGAEPGKKQGYDAHEEIELALVKLYRLTSDPRHLKQAQFFIDARGQMPPYFDDEARRRGEDPKDYVYKDYSYSQAHIPVREQTRVVGHAVRAMYLFSAMADVAVETGDMTLLAACNRLFDNLTTRQLYVTGGLGPAHTNEGFTREYDLPNDTAYAETCAAVALAFWGSRMAQIELDARFTDHVELVLFNGALSGLSRDGEHYFYDNVLESHGDNRRWKWHYCPCCPTNIARLIASLGSYFYSSRDDDLAVHLYGANTARVQVAGREVKISQETRYPWDGDIRIVVTPDAPQRLALKLRIPGWCRKVNFAVNGEAVEPKVARGYATIDRHWQPDDEVRVHFEMPVERISAHPAVTQDVGRVALKRGPVVYCLEQVDNGVAPQRFVLAPGTTIDSAFDPDLLGGATVLTGEAEIVSEVAWSDTLYRASPPQREAARFRAIPYHLWANREAGGMLVWIRQDGS